MPDPAREYASPYVSVGNDPTNGTDPDGRCRKCRRAARTAKIGDQITIKGEQLTFYGDGFGKWGGWVANGDPVPNVEPAYTPMTITGTGQANSLFDAAGEVIYTTALMAAGGELLVIGGNILKGASLGKNVGLLKNLLPVSTEGKMMGEIVNGKFVMNGATKAAGEFDFIVSAEGRVLLGRKHSFLSGGADVQAAGTLKIRNGQIVNVTNLSGHYAPSLQQSTNFLEVLSNSGVNIQRSHFKIYDANGNVLKHVTPVGYGN